MTRRPAFALSLVALIAAACGGGTPAATSSSPSAAATAAASVETLDARLTRLYEAAKAEGKVAAYWSLNVQFADPLIKKFEARFPGVKVDHTRANSGTLVQRITTEKKAGQEFFDIAEMEAFDMQLILDQGVIQPYRVASWDDFPNDAKSSDGRWIATRLNNDYPAINTTKVKPGEVKTWKDLCDKKYEGKVAVERDQVAIYSALKKVLGESEAKATIGCIAANKPSLRTGNTEMANLLAAGEFWIVLSLHAPAVTPLKYEKNAPVDLVRTTPVITYTQTIGLAAKPAHPNAAKLFMEWMTSPEGQQALADAGQTPASKTSKTKYPELTATGQLFFIRPELAADFERDAEFWRTTFGTK